MTGPEPARSATLLTRTVTVVNMRGLHARAAAKFVKLAGQYNATLLVSNRGTEVSGLSIMGLMMLAAAPGCTIEIKGRGPQGNEAVAALVALVEAKFYED